MATGGLTYFYDRSEQPQNKGFMLHPDPVVSILAQKNSWAQGSQ